MRSAGSIFEASREQLLCSTDGDVASCPAFSWPDLAEFNWASDWFDPSARGNHDPAVIWSDADGAAQQISFEALRDHSNRAAGWLIRQGVGPGTRILVALEGSAALWEVQLAALKLGAIVVAASPVASRTELMDILTFAGATVLITSPESAQDIQLAATWTGITVGGSVPGWSVYEDSYSHTLRYRLRERHCRVPFLLECIDAGVRGRRLRGLLHSHYACTVGRLTDLRFTRLRPGQRYVTAAPAGSMEHLCFSFLGPLTAGVTTLLVSPQDCASAAALASQAASAAARSAYAPMALFGTADVRQAQAMSHPEVEVFSSVTVEMLAETNVDLYARATGSSWPGVPPNTRWGVRHHQTSIGMMVQTDGKTQAEDQRAVALPGHSLRVLSPRTGVPAETGDVWIDLCRWPDASAPRWASYGDAQRLAGIGSLSTGLFGRRLSSGSVVLAAA